MPTHSYTISQVNVAKTKAWDICFLFYCTVHRVVQSYDHATENPIFCSSSKQSQLSSWILTAVLWCAAIQSYNRTIVHWKDSRCPGLSMDVRNSVRTRMPAIHVIWRCHKKFLSDCISKLHMTQYYSPCDMESWIFGMIKFQVLSKDQRVILAKFKSWQDELT